MKTLKKGKIQQLQESSQNPSHINEQEEEIQYCKKRKLNPPESSQNYSIFGLRDSVRFHQIKQVKQCIINNNNYSKTARDQGVSLEKIKKLRQELRNEPDVNQLIHSKNAYTDNEIEQICWEHYITFKKSPKNSKKIIEKWNNIQQSISKHLENSELIQKFNQYIQENIDYPYTSPLKKLDFQGEEDENKQETLQVEQNENLVKKTKELEKNLNEKQEEIKNLQESISTHQQLYSSQLFQLQQLDSSKIDLEIEKENLKKNQNEQENNYLHQISELQQKLDYQTENYDILEKKFKNLTKKSQSQKLILEKKLQKSQDSLKAQEKNLKNTAKNYKEQEEKILQNQFKIFELSKKLQTAEKNLEIHLKDQQEQKKLQQTQLTTLNQDYEKKILEKTQEINKLSQKLENNKRQYEQNLQKQKEEYKHNLDHQIQNQQELQQKLHIEKIKNKQYLEEINEQNVLLGQFQSKNEKFINQTNQSQQSIKNSQKQLNFSEIQQKKIPIPPLKPETFKELDSIQLNKVIQKINQNKEKYIEICVLLNNRLSLIFPPKTSSDQCKIKQKKLIDQNIFLISSLNIEKRDIEIDSITILSDNNENLENLHQNLLKQNKYPIKSTEKKQSDLILLIQFQFPINKYLFIEQSNIWQSSV